jgi:hypothetical protein
MRQIRFNKSGGKIRLQPQEMFSTITDGYSIVIINQLPLLTVEEKIAGIDRDKYFTID